MSLSIASPSSLPATLMSQSPAPTAASLPDPSTAGADDKAAQEKFNSIMGEMVFHEMLKSMRRTVDKPAYLHGGQAEEVFTSRLDQVLAQQLGETHGEQLLGTMYNAWSGARR
jgi:Rod binding domain-containing protein